MRRMLEKAVGNEMMRYLFFGVCTTVVNLGMFTALRYKVGLNVRISNLLSIITAIVFAFLVNKWFVFQSGEEM